MKLIRRLFLFYCMILSIFITISTPFPYQLLFVPVALYLIFYSYTQIKRKAGKPQPSHRELWRVMLSLVILGGLLGFSLYNINIKQTRALAEKASIDKQRVASQSATIVKSPFPTLVLIQATSSAALIDIYAEATSSSKVIAKAKSGEGYRALSQKGQWLQINLSTEQTGWIKQTDVIFSKGSKK